MLNAVTKRFCVTFEGHSINGEKLDLFHFLKYIIFIKIIKNVTDVMVPGFTLGHHGSVPLCGMSLVENFADSFGVSENSASTCVV